MVGGALKFLISSFVGLLAVLLIAVLTVVVGNNATDPQARARLTFNEDTYDGTKSYTVNNFINDFSYNAKFFISQLGEQVGEHFLNVHKNVLNVSAIEITGNYYVSDDEFKSWLLNYDQSENKKLVNTGYNKFPDVSIFNAIGLFSLSRIKQNPWIEDARVSWNILPLSVSVDILEISPWFVAEWEGDTWLVARNGNLVSPLKFIKNKDVLFKLADLMRVDGLSEMKTEVSSVSSSNSRIKLAVSFLTMLDAVGGMPYKVERYTLLPLGAMRIAPYDFEKYPIVLIDFTDFASAEKTIFRLKAVMSDLSKRQEHVSEIDLRFDTQVVVR